MFTETEIKRLGKIIAVGVVTLPFAACTPWLFDYLHELGLFDAPIWVRTLVALLVLGLYFQYSANPFLRLMEERKERRRVEGIRERYGTQGRKQSKKHK